MRLVIVAFPVQIGTATWGHKRVVLVLDFTADFWRPFDRRIVDDFNAKLPVILPRLKYVEMGSMRCGKLPAIGRKGGISVCSSLDVPHSYASMASHGTPPTSALVDLYDDPGYRHPGTGPAGLVCHKLAHAVYGAHNATQDQPFPSRTESCIQGNLD